MTEAFPFLVRILRMIQREESRLLTNVQELFQALINLKRAYAKLAEIAPLLYDKFWPKKVKVKMKSVEITQL